jgi:hypothetical protein
MKKGENWRGLLLFVFLLTLSACYPSRPRSAFEEVRRPLPPDYHNLDFWAAHPAKMDSADVVPSDSMINAQDSAIADVFYIHPTTYTGKLGQNLWNGPVDDRKLNEDTDDGAVKNQATIFNKCYRVFAPRYRQAHYVSYTTKRKEAALKALDLAYSDIRSAFLHYLEHENMGRPIIIAGHSQGTTHGVRLLQEFFDTTDLKKQLIAAYLPGMPVREDAFTSLETCTSSESIGCINSWRTMKAGHFPKYHEDYKDEDVICVNPLNWSTDQEYVDRFANKGMVLLDFYDGPVPHLSGGKIKEGLMWINKPCFKGSWIIMSSDYHAGDFNLFYSNIRENACERLYHYTKRNFTQQ